MWDNGLTFLPRIPPIPILESIGNLYAPSLLIPQPYHPVNWAGAIGSVCFGITFHLVTVFVLAYGLSILATGDTLLYTVLTKLKDDKNLLEVPESFEEESLTSAQEEPKEEEKKEMHHNGKYSRDHLSFSRGEEGGLLSFQNKDGMKEMNRNRRNDNLGDTFFVLEFN